jgi:site-specific recombinase XerD
MSLKVEKQRTLQVSNVDDYLLNWLEAFLIDRKASGVADGTLRFYRQKIKLFSDYCDAQVVKQIGQINPSFLRQYLLYLDDSGHNAGGRHAAFRTIRAFFLWYEDEVEPQGWSNPIRKVKAPKVPVEPLEPVSFDTVTQMVKVCQHNNFTGDRDAAILLCLLDTGARANEFLCINLEDINQARGDILIRQGKGHKPRTVYQLRIARRMAALSTREWLEHIEVNPLCPSFFWLRTTSSRNSIDISHCFLQGRLDVRASNGARGERAAGRTQLQSTLQSPAI